MEQNINELITITNKNIVEQLSFDLDKNEYTSTFSYSLLKSFTACSELILAQSRESLIGFDDLILRSEKVFTPIKEFMTTDVQYDTTNIISKAVGPFTYPYSFHQPSEDIGKLMESAVAAYQLIAIVVISLFLKDDDINGIISKEIDSYPDDSNEMLYTPFERECTLNYFINRYIINSKHGTSPDTELLKQGDYYRLLIDNYNNEALIMDLGDYGHGNTKHKRKQGILSSDIMLGSNAGKVYSALRNCILCLSDLEGNSDKNNIRFQQLVKSPSAETIPYMGYSALASDIAIVNSEIYKSLSAQEIYLHNSLCLESFYQLKEYIRLINDTAAALYFGDKMNHFDDYIAKLQEHTSDLTLETIGKDVINHKRIAPGTTDAMIALLQSMLLLEVESQVKVNLQILRFISDNAAVLCDSMTATKGKPVPNNETFVPLNNTDFKSIRCRKIVQFIIGVDDATFGIVHDIVSRIYKQLWGETEKVDMLDYTAACQLVLLSKCKGLTGFKPLNFYKRKGIDNRFSQQYDRSVQSKESLSAILKQDKFTIEECHLIRSLIDTLKYLILGVDIFKVYTEELKILKALDDAYTNSNTEWGTSAYNHIIAGETVLIRCNNMIQDLFKYLKQIGISVSINPTVI